jgi:hypothetical protein
MAELEDSCKDSRRVPGYARNAGIGAGRPCFAHSIAQPDNVDFKERECQQNDHI